MNKRFIITGGAGFIGSAVVRHLIEASAHEVCVVDKLTYAGNLDNLARVAGDPRYQFKQADICDAHAMRQICESFRPDTIIHLAAESHVDRSIDGPGAFIETNVVGTYVLLQSARDHWQKLNLTEQARFRFHHVSTDEVFGSLGPDGLF
ncbi:MAG: GDP-mannose 4,6-dehydratase, partial [Methylocella sp.]